MVHERRPRRERKRLSRLVAYLAALLVLAAAFSGCVQSNEDEPAGDADPSPEADGSTGTEQTGTEDQEEEEQAPRENAQIRVSGFDEDNNGADDWLRLVLVRGENSPYAWADVEIDTSGTHAATSSGACDVPRLSAGACEDPFAEGEEWSVGSVKYVPCQAQGSHHVTVAILEASVLDEHVGCDEPAS